MALILQKNGQQRKVVVGRRILSFLSVPSNDPIFRFFPHLEGKKVTVKGAGSAAAAGDLSIDPSDLITENQHQPTPRGRRGGGRGRGRGRGGSRGGRSAAAATSAVAAAAPQLASQLIDNSVYVQGEQQQTILMDAHGQAILQAEGGDTGTMTVEGGDAEAVDIPANAVGPLEVTLAQLSPDHAPATCRHCGPQVQNVFDNARELCIHMELDHGPTSVCEQLGCQACGRIFFGPHHRNDLFGHFRAVHQSTEATIPCANHEPVQLLSTSGAEDQLNLTGGGCLAKFTSSRLCDSHLLADPQCLPGWACPLSLEHETLQAMTVVASPDCQQFLQQNNQQPMDTMVLATEIAADAAGQMILAYGCPLCSRVFTGENCTGRYFTHRMQCGVQLTTEDGTVVVMDPNAVTMTSEGAVTIDGQQAVIMTVPEGMIQPQEQPPQQQ